MPTVLKRATLHSVRRLQKTYRSFQVGNISRRFKSGESSMKKNAGPCGPATGGKTTPPSPDDWRGRQVNSRLLLALASVIINHEANPTSQKSDHQRNGYQTENYRIVPAHGTSSVT